MRNNKFSIRCHCGNCPQSLQRCDLKTILSDRRMICISHIPVFPIKIFFFPLRVWNNSINLTGQINTRHFAHTKHASIFFDVCYTDPFLLVRRKTPTNFIKIYIRRNSDRFTHICPPMSFPVIEHCTQFRVPRVRHNQLPGTQYLFLRGDHPFIKSRNCNNRLYDRPRSISAGHYTI